MKVEPIKRRKLNLRQQKFADLVLQGVSQGEAYRQAYGDGNKNFPANAYRLMRHPEVKAYVAEMRELAKSELVLSLQRKREFLAKIVNTPISEVDTDSDLCQTYTVSTAKDGSTKEKLEMPSKLEAIKVDNRLSGDDSPDKLEIETGNELAQLLKSISGKTTGLE